MSLSDTIKGATIYHTTDGSTPSPGVGTTTVYKASFDVTATTTVKASATASGYANCLVASATYTLQAAGATGTSIRVRAGASTPYGGSVYEVTQPIGEYIADDETFSTTVQAANMARGGPHLRFEALRKGAASHRPERAGPLPKSRQNCNSVILSFDP
jgi:Fn3 associated